MRVASANELSGVDPYVTAVESLQETVFVQEPDWLRARRLAALTRFADGGFPTPRDEAWKYTSLTPLLKQAFDPGSADARVTEALIRPLLFGVGRGVVLVFVNGRFAEGLSRLENLPDGVSAGSLAVMLRRRAEWLEPHLASDTVPGRRPFYALNTASFQDGACLVLGPNAQLDRPIQCVFVATSNARPLVSHPRNVLVLGRGSSASMIERYVSIGEGVSWTNAVTEIVLGPNARLNHCKIEEDGDRSFHVGALQVRQQRDSVFESSTVSLGGRLVRHTHNVALAEPGASCQLDGLTLLDGERHTDTQTEIDHLQPHTTSRQLYKGILDGTSHSVFSGKIFVRPDAQKIDASQTNKHLLLSDGATVDTRPQLEIFADDVKCAHGAAVGQLDDDQLFYLQSRGFADEHARRVLTFGFANEVIGRVPVISVLTWLEGLLLSRLSIAQLRERQEASTRAVGGSHG